MRQLCIPDSAGTQAGYRQQVNLVVQEWGEESGVPSETQVVQAISFKLDRCREEARTTCLPTLIRLTPQLSPIRSSSLVAGYAGRLANQCATWVLIGLEHAARQPTSNTPKGRVPDDYFNHGLEPHAQHPRADRCSKWL